MARKVVKKTQNSVPGRGPAWTFPKHSLEVALAVPKAIEDKNGGNPWPSSELAKAVGYQKATDWRYLELLRGANQYGLVSGTGTNAVVSLTDLGRDVVAPSSAAQRSQALWKAFRSVQVFADVDAHYQNKRIPEDEFFLNTLTRQFAIPRERVEIFADIFRANQT